MVGQNNYPEFFAYNLKNLRWMYGDYPMNPENLSRQDRPL